MSSTAWSRAGGAGSWGQTHPWGLCTGFLGQAEGQRFGEGAARPERALCVQSSSVKPQESDSFPRGVSHPRAHQHLTECYSRADGSAKKLCNKGEVASGQSAESKGELLSLREAAVWGAPPAPAAPLDLSCPLQPLCPFPGASRCLTRPGQWLEPPPKRR